MPKTSFQCSNKNTYTTLAAYNASTQGYVNGPASVTPRYNMGTTIVPVWGSMGYEALTHDNAELGRCGGYYTIKAAYPDYSKGSCGRYAKRACAGTVLK